jgi:uncharacterized membrane protein
MNHFKSWLPAVPLATGTLSFLNIASARDHFMRGPGFAGFFSLLVSLLFIALLVLAILYLFQLYRARQTENTQPSNIMPTEVRPTGARVPAPNDSALAILRERLARGEIDPEDFEARRRILSETR